MIDFLLNNISYIQNGALIAAGLFALDRLGLWAEARGYVYYRKNKPRGGSGAGGALGEMQAFLQPSARHVIEVQEQADVRERDDQGDGHDR